MSSAEEKEKEEDSCLCLFFFLQPLLIYLFIFISCCCHLSSVFLSTSFFFCNTLCPLLTLLEKGGRMTQAPAASASASVCCVSPCSVSSMKLFIYFYFLSCCLSSSVLSYVWHPVPKLFFVTLLWPLHSLQPVTALLCIPSTHILHSRTHWLSASTDLLYSICSSPFLSPPLLYLNFLLFANFAKYQTPVCG